MCHQLPHAISCQIKQGHGHVVLAIAGHYAVYSPIQGTHYVQTWPRPVHSGLAVTEEPCRKQRSGNH